MRVIEYAKRFNALLGQVQYLNDRDGRPPPRTFPEDSEEVAQFKAGNLPEDCLTLDALCTIRDQERNEQLKEALRFTTLRGWLERETWAPREALPILAGLDPDLSVLTWPESSSPDRRFLPPNLRKGRWFTAWPARDHQDGFASSLEGFSLQKQLHDADQEGYPELLEAAEKIFFYGWTHGIPDEREALARLISSLREKMLTLIGHTWFSANHDTEQRHSPDFFLRWAESHGFLVEWATWARSEALVESDFAAEAPPFFDPESLEYPKALHIAVRAWEYAKKSSGGTPKQRILSYLEARYPDLTGSEKEAIALVGNWQKAAGRPRKNGGDI